MSKMTPQQIPKQAQSDFKWPAILLKRTSDFGAQLPTLRNGVYVIFGANLTKVKM